MLSEAKNRIVIIFLTCAFHISVQMLQQLHLEWCPGLCAAWEMERTKKKTCDHQGIQNMFFGSYMSLSHEPIRLYDTIIYYNILYLLYDYDPTICISSKCDAEYMMCRRTRHLSSHIGWSVPALRTSKMPPASSTWSQRSQRSQRLRVSQTVQTVQRRGIKKISRLGSTRLGCVTKRPRPVGWDLRISRLRRKHFCCLLQTTCYSSIAKQHLLKKEHFKLMQVSFAIPESISKCLFVSDGKFAQDLRSKWTQPLPQCHVGPGDLRREQLKILKQNPIYISSSIYLCLYLPIESTYIYIYTELYIYIYIYIKQENIWSLQEQQNTKSSYSFGGKPRTSLLKRAVSRQFFRLYRASSHTLQIQSHKHAESCKNTQKSLHIGHISAYVYIHTYIHNIT